MNRPTATTLNFHCIKQPCFESRPRLSVFDRRLQLKDVAGCFQVWQKASWSSLHSEQLGREKDGKMPHANAERRSKLFSEEVEGLLGM